MSRELVSHTFPTLINGVSEQHESVRLESQSQMELNTQNDVVYGMGRRSGTHQVAQLDSKFSDCYLHPIDRSSYEQYAVAITSTGISVVDLLNGGASVPVEYEGGAVSYLALPSGAVPRLSYSAITVADTTWILNKEKVIYVDPSDTQKPEPPEQVVSPDFLRTDITLKSVADSSYRATGYWRIIVGSLRITRSESTDIRQVTRELCNMIKKAYPSFRTYYQGTKVSVEHPSGTTVALDDESYKRYRKYHSGHDRGYTYTTSPISGFSEATFVVQGAGGGSGYTSGIVYIKQADYKVNYKVIINNHTYSHVTPEATSAQARAGLSVETILKAIANQINSDSALGGIKAIVDTDYMRIYHPKGKSYVLEAASDLSGEAIVAFQDEVQTYSLLPPRAPRGYHVRVVGDPKEASDPYYLRFDSKKGSSNGVWKETTALGIDNTIDATTMPHKLTRQFKDDGSVYFRLTAQELTERKAGDDETNPMPSFVFKDGEYDGKAQAIFFFRNRLGMLAGSNVILSTAGEYENWFAASMLTPLDTDPIDLASPTSEVAQLAHATSLNRQMVVFTPKTQHLIQSGDTLTAETCALPQISSYDADPNITPVALGDRMFYTAFNSEVGLSTLHEAVIINVDENLVSTDVGTHVPTQIKGRVTHLAGSKLHNKLVVVTDLGNIYLYGYYYNGQERIQSAWSTWTTDGDIKAMRFVRDILYFVIERHGTLWLESMYLTSDPTEGTHGFPVHMDSMHTVDKSYVKKDWETVWYNPRNGVYEAGIPFSTEYTFSPILYRDANGKAVQRSRLQIRNLNLDYVNTGAFRIHVTPLGRETRIDQFTNRIIGDIRAVLGSPPVSSGSYSIPIISDGRTVDIKLYSDFVYPMRIQSAGYEAMLNLRSRPT